MADLGDRLADGGGLDHRGTPRTDAGDAARVVLGSSGHEVTDIGGPVPRVGGTGILPSHHAAHGGVPSVNRDLHVAQALPARDPPLHALVVQLEVAVGDGVLRHAGVGRRRIRHEGGPRQGREPSQPDAPRGVDAATIPGAVARDDGEDLLPVTGIPRGVAQGHSPAVGARGVREGGGVGLVGGGPDACVRRRVIEGEVRGRH